MQRYDILKKIGKGSFGTVDLVRRRKDGYSFVIKRMKVGSVSKKEREMCHNEVGLLERLNHPSIVRYEESFLHTQHGETYLCVVMSYCDGGDLTHFLKNQRGKRLREKHVLDLFVQIALALHFVHNRNILHRDLKAQNIFVKDGQLKLGDFGISKVLTGSVAFAQTVIGTPYYMSPEVFKGKPYDLKSDVWSLGCILYEFMTFKHAFDANNLNSLAQKIVRGKYLPITYHQYRNELKGLCYSMLNQSPSQRPTLKQILKNKLLANRIRDFYISCYKKLKKNMLTQSTFNNLKNQLYEIGLTHVLENIDDIAKKQSLKKEEQKKLQEERKSIEKEKKIQRDMEAALEKLKNERKWRAAQKKQRQKILKKHNDDYHYNPYQQKKVNFGRKRSRVRSMADAQYMAEKRREAAKNRKFELLKKQEQKRQELAAKHRNKQQRASQRKNNELNRKSPYMQRVSPNKPSPKKAMRQFKSNSPKKRKEEQQVEQLNMWENAHVINNNNNRQNQQHPRSSGVKKQNLVLIPDKEPQYHSKAALPSKSPLSLLQQKMKYQKEYDALEGLKKRREVIQQRLNEISERHRQRQLRKVQRNTNDTHQSPQRPPRTRSKSELPFRAKSEQPLIAQNPSSIHTISKSKSTHHSLQSSPYKKPPQLRGTRIPFASPNKPKPLHNNSHSHQHTPSPLKVAGANALGLSSNASSIASSMSVSPETEINPSMNPRERMQARKRAKADARARQLKQASVAQFHKNQFQAQQNKYAVSGGNKESVPKIQRAVSLEELDVPEIGGAVDVDVDGTMSEPPYIRESKMNEYPRDIMTIQERSEEVETESGVLEEDEEEDMIQDEIDELKQTLMEHTKQIEEIKNTLIMKQKENLSESDDDEDGEVIVDDVETLLNEQEQTMRTMRLKEIEKERQIPNDQKHARYRQVMSPNNIDVTYSERLVNPKGMGQGMEVESDGNNDGDGDDDGDESSEEMPIGRLADRIEFIKRKCIDGMGLEGFKIAYSLMKQLQLEEKDELVSAIDSKIKQLCKKPNLSKARVQKYRSLIDQLLFIEANCS